MFYLLPEKNRNELKREYRMRSALLCSAAFGIVLISASVAVIPAYFYSSARMQTLDGERFALASTDTMALAKTSEATLAKAKARLDQVKPATSDISVSDVVSGAVSVKPAGVKIRDISLATSDKFSVRISGNASNRDALSAFSKALVNRFKSSSVESPNSNLLKNSDIDFTISISGK